ncbi:MAG: PD-(D/E)XK nuclease family protein [Lewinellaceae bacterium]|nr:PD-(D/E)XK nuclease family protein [Phaeodactylibacter sp.]MCB0614609.1 PD-(D/E)XK nuclease family protein [Phaeodactylibacter sp.]MCB9348810.1 PD-(D/E)XK nuclease family protein [Lewinellaceae bacterium]
MKVYFGMALDDTAFPLPEHTTGGAQHLGPQGILYFLEAHLGLLGHPSDDEYLRIEQYRQAIRRQLQSASGLFYQASFEADQFATATNLLERRDELLLAGWDFRPDESLPERLHCLAELEQILRQGALSLSPGYAGRFTAVLEALPRRQLPLETIFVNEPLELLPVHFQRLFTLLREHGVDIRQLPAPEIKGDTDLARFQRTLSSEAAGGKKQPLSGDGSLLLLRGKRESSLAAYLAQLLRLNPGFRPACLISGQDSSFGHALIQEGLPGLGQLSASLARPTLQVLKLVTVFLWEPVDPYKIMEFVSLSAKPLEKELANRIAAQMAQTPGIDSDAWRATIARYFDEMRERAAHDSGIDLKKIEYQYNFWFRRQRYDLAQSVPKEEVIKIFAYLAQWAFECFEEEGSKNNSLLVLSEQAKRIRELLEALPEEQLSNLELERIVRTIYEPAPVQLRGRECNFLPYVQQPHAFIGEAPQLLWWTFTQNEPVHFFSRWYQPEIACMEKQGILLQGPALENARLIWQRKRPILHCRERLLLVLPEMANGQETHPHPLYGDLQAAFSGLESISLNPDIDKGQPGTPFHTIFELPRYIELEHRKLGQPKPFLRIRAADKLSRREEETFSSLNDLFYYPYQWVFKHQIRLRKSSILSIVKENTLMGNLAHRYFEKLLREDTRSWNQQQLEAFIDRETAGLLRREGAVMLLYGKEPERASFVQRVKYAAWSLVKHIRENGWEVLETEKPLEGAFMGTSINGRADIVLQRGEERAVIDLKWRGARYREQSIRNEEDLQLVLYARLLGAGHSWAHTAYFIMERGLLLARNNHAFQDINAVAPNADFVEANQRILNRMEATYRWRMEQIRKGEVEIRCKQTQLSLEDAYNGLPLMDILEMKEEDAPFDDYRTLINLIE